MRVLSERQQMTSMHPKAGSYVGFKQLPTVSVLRAPHCFAYHSLRDINVATLKPGHPEKWTGATVVL
eukprot:42486-Eustigmatos_ZCMA.PRE.1